MTASRSTVQKFAWLSVATSVVTLGFKLVAWQWTGSVGLLSDALESFVNLAAASVTLWAVIAAARPPDEEHAFGHDKIEFFASGFEGALILTASAVILVTASQRLLEPAELQEVGFGLTLALIASVCNLVTGLLLVRAGDQHHSPALKADGHHLLSDVWTSVGVLVGVALAVFTGWTLLDPLIALAVGLYIARTGVRILRGAVQGLMDHALPEAQLQAIDTVLGRYREEGLDFHALRTRSSASRQFVSVHVLVPDEWTVQRAHDQVEEIEADLRRCVPNGVIFTHLEPLDDPKSWQDESLDGPAGGRDGT